MNILGPFQRLGRALQSPIAVLPVAMLLPRFDQLDLLNAAFTAQAGGAIFDSLVLIFAIGVASSWSKGSTDAAALAGIISYSVLTKAMMVISPEINMGVLAGITTGLVGGAAYNRWSDIKLLGFLNFFDGKHFMSIAVGFLYLVLAAIFSYVWPLIQHTIHAGGEWIASAGMLGPGIPGLINRPLVPTGLHQALNTIAWLQIGEFTSAAGTVFHGDINRFYAGDDTAGMFISGFFSIMTFGLPDTALTVYFAVPKERRPMVGGALLSVAVIVFLTGVTGPSEFLFTLLVPLLYLLHALLTGISLFVATLLSICTDFFFSAGAIDYTLMYNLPATNQSVWMLLVMRVVFFAIYFVVFGLVIRMFNLKTSGREDKGDKIVTEEANSNTEEGLNQLTTSYIVAVGGADNLKAIDVCITRLRLAVIDSTHVNDAICKCLGISGVVELDKQTIQAIVGAKVGSTGNVMKKVVIRGPVTAASTEAILTATIPAARPQAVSNAISIAELVSSITGDVMALDQVPDEAFASRAADDGVAVRPTDKIVVSPAAGTIVRIFNTNRAFCLETERGAEIIVHMGIDTVALEGKSFKRLMEEGVQVNTGQPVLEMDLDYLNANARLMINPVACSNIGDLSGLTIKAQGHVVVGQTPLYKIKR